MATEEGPKDLQADQEQAQPGGECVTSEEQPQPTMPTKDQQERWQSAEAKEIHPTESCQVTLGDQEEGMGTHGGGKGPSLPPTQMYLCWWRLRIGAGRRSVSLGHWMVLAVGITVFPSGLVYREALSVSWGEGRERVV